MAMKENDVQTDTSTPKRQRTRLAKAELWMHLACTAQRWADDLRKPATPILTWPKDAPEVELMDRYDLTPDDLARICERIAQEIENRSVRAGFEEHWD